MSSDSKTHDLNDNTATSKKTRGSMRMEKPEIPISFSSIVDAVKKLDIKNTKVIDEAIFLFNALRELKNISNDQIYVCLRGIRSQLIDLWSSFLVRATMELCRRQKENDARIIQSIQAMCKEQLAEYNISDSLISNAERNACLLSDGKYVIQFLQEASRGKHRDTEMEIPNSELARLCYVCFTLYRRFNNGSNHIQLLIERAIAEFFSNSELSGIKERELVGIVMGDILAAKVYSPKRISELTYLYAGTSTEFYEQKARIRSLDEIRRNQLDTIHHLQNESKMAAARNCELREQVAALTKQAAQYESERNAAENMLAYEKNKFERQLQSQADGLKAELLIDIGLEMQALRELAEYLSEDDRRRFLRRFDRIDQYLQEFGGK